MAGMRLKVLSILREAAREEERPRSWESAFILVAGWLCFVVVVVGVVVVVVVD